MTAPTKSRHFCICIPVRFGVFFLSFWSLIASGVVAGFIWYALGQGSRSHVKIANNLKVGLIVAGVIYTIFALISLAGLVGSLIRSRGLVRTFSIFLWFQLFVSLAYLIAFSIALFDKPLQNRLITECMKQTKTGDAIVKNNKDATLTPEQLRTGCASPFTTNKPAFFVAFAIFFLLTLYSCIVVRRYGKQLRDEQEYRASANSGAETTQAAFQPSYYPHTPLSRVEPGYGGGNSHAYPYAQREHGFGSSNRSVSDASSTHK
jgi:ABC-type multidrug transport system fused ATPase/permease subunit